MQVRCEHEPWTCSTSTTWTPEFLNTLLKATLELNVLKWVIVFNGQSEHDCDLEAEGLKVISLHQSDCEMWLHVSYLFCSFPPSSSRISHDCRWYSTVASISAESWLTCSTYWPQTGGMYTNKHTPSIHLGFKQRHKILTRYLQHYTLENFVLLMQ